MLQEIFTSCPPSLPLPSTSVVLSKPFEQLPGCRSQRPEHRPAAVDAGHADSPSPDGSSCWCLCTQTSPVVLQSHWSQPFPLTSLQQQPNSSSSRPDCTWQAGRACSALLEMPWLHGNTQPWRNKALLLMCMPWLDLCQESRAPDPSPPVFPGAAQKQTAMQAQHSWPQAEALEELVFGRST